MIDACKPPIKSTWLQKQAEWWGDWWPSLLEAVSVTPCVAPRLAERV